MPTRGGAEEIGCFAGLVPDEKGPEDRRRGPPAAPGPGRSLYALYARLVVGSGRSGVPRLAGAPSELGVRPGPRQASEPALESGMPGPQRGPSECDEAQIVAAEIPAAFVTW